MQQTLPTGVHSHRSPLLYHRPPAAPPRAILLGNRGRRCCALFSLSSVPRVTGMPSRLRQLRRCPVQCHTRSRPGRRQRRSISDRHHRPRRSPPTLLRPPVGGDHVSPVHPTILVHLPRFGDQMGLIPDSPAGRFCSTLGSRPSTRQATPRPGTLCPTSRSPLQPPHRSSSGADRRLQSALS